MKTGFYGIHLTDEGVSACYIDQESLELTRQNRIVEQRLAALEERKRLTARREARRRRAVVRLLRQELALVSAGVAAVAAGSLGLMVPWLAAALSVLSLSAACFQAGRYYYTWRCSK